MRVLVAGAATVVKRLRPVAGKARFARVQAPLPVSRKGFTDVGLLAREPAVKIPGRISFSAPAFVVAIALRNILVMEAEEVATISLHVKPFVAYASWHCGVVQTIIDTCGVVQKNGVNVTPFWASIIVAFLQVPVITLPMAAVHLHSNTP